MFERHVIPTEYSGYAIQVTTEEQSDGGWAAVAVVLHDTSHGRSIMPVPLPPIFFTTEREARDGCVREARRWLDANVPAEGEATTPA